MDHGDTGDRPGQTLPDGMSPLEMLLAQEAEARAARPRPSSGREAGAPRQPAPEARRPKRGGSKLLAGVAGVVVLAMAVGGTLLYMGRSNDSDVASPTSSAVEEPAPAAAEPEGTTATPSAEEDGATAARMVLTPADVPGFRVSADEGASDGFDLGVCVRGNQLLDSNGEPARGADAPGLERASLAGLAKVKSGVAFGQTEFDAIVAFDAVSAFGVGECLATIVRNAGGQDPDIKGTASSSSVALARMGDESIGHRIVSTVVGPGGATFVFYFDVVAIRQGRALALFLFMQDGEPWPLDEIERLGRTVIGRMPPA